MITKAIVRSINASGNRCVVRMPLFENASSTSPVESEALVCITPGFFNNIFVGDVVFVGFEENALEKPIIIGKLYKGTSYETETPGGAGVLDSLHVRTSAKVPCSTLFVYPDSNKAEYTNFNTPKKLADYIKWLEKLTKKLVGQLDDNFKCFKNWTQWQLKPENVEIDDGNIDASDYVESTPSQYQKENAECKVCGNSKCTKNLKRKYTNIVTTTVYPNN